MKKSILFSFIVVLLVVIAGGFYLYTTKKSTEKIEEQPIVVLDYKNISYGINGQMVKLVDGVSERESVPGSSSKTITKYFGNEIQKDLNNDGKQDVAFLLTEEMGGSGTFYYVVAALATDTGYEGSQAVLLGDRISPQTTESGPENSIIVNYLDRGPKDPMATAPSIGKSLRLILDAKTMQFGEVAQNFEGEADPQRMELGMKTWKWIKAEYSDGKVVKPTQDVFTIVFKKDGTFAATTDCNGVGGGYTTKKSALAFGNMMSTLMYCDGSQESDFKKILESTQSYLFTSKGELVLNLKMDSGSVYFK